MKHTYLAQLDVGRRMKGFVWIMEGPGETGTGNTTVQGAGAAGPLA